MSHFVCIPGRSKSVPAQTKCRVQHQQHNETSEHLAEALSQWCMDDFCQLSTDQQRRISGKEVSINPGHGELVSGLFKQLLCRHHFTLSHSNQPVDVLLQNSNLPIARAFAMPASIKVLFSFDSQLLLSVRKVHKGDTFFVPRLSTIPKLDKVIKLDSFLLEQKHRAWNKLVNIMTITCEVITNIQDGISHKSSAVFNRTVVHCHSWVDGTLHVVPVTALWCVLQPACKVLLQNLHRTVVDSLYSAKYLQNTTVLGGQFVVTAL